jgi:hypothetical protein
VTTDVPDWVDIPVYDRPGTPTGETVRVPVPPPQVFDRGPHRDGARDVLELQRVEVLRRFGCGCFREEELRYVRSAGHVLPAASMIDRR